MYIALNGSPFKDKLSRASSSAQAHACRAATLATHPHTHVHTRNTPSLTCAGREGRGAHDLHTSTSSELPAAIDLDHRADRRWRAGTYQHHHSGLR